MSYRKSNDNWKQLLIRLDELGERAFFIHLLVNRCTNKHVQQMRTSRCMAGKIPAYLFYDSVRGVCESKHELQRFQHIYNKL